MYKYDNRGWRTYEEDTKPQVVYIKDDKLGKERFQKLEEEFKTLERTERHNGRHSQISAVFYHRLQLAEQAEFPRTYPGARERLEKFKPVKVFLTAMQELIDEIKKEHADKFKVKQVKKAEAARNRENNSRSRYRW